MGTTQVAVARPATTIASQATVEELDGGAGWLRVATEDPAAWLPGARYSSATVASIKVSAVRVRSGNDGDTRIEVLT